MIQFELLLERILRALDPLAARLGVDTDKLAHGIGCLLLAVAGGLALGTFEGFLLALVLGIAWEGFSYVWRHVEPDPEDVVADFVGAAIGAGLLGLLGLLA